ncbi:PREDICTED: receptor kinase-like protein Xa21 [Ipomoea nil]|uniref:receptor kinase-like protein Xa21 n=1 Tax=Ipomoea nil TaxID=35883 RepID=UPI0009011F25|nr:PREDICTED: receptor kinase-like protein Xa21 [Ipomoea nil]
MGSIPPHIFNISSMLALGLNDNNISGTIPREICNYPRLGGLYLQFNSLSGSIPWCIFNISTLWQINFNSNYLSGSLPPRMGYKLPNLDGIGLSLNRITGNIPSYISNCSYLTAIYFDSNSFNGPIPNSLGELRWLRLLDLFDNKLTTESSSVGFNIVTSLANCKYLRELWLDNNTLNTVLPSSFGNLSISLDTFTMAGCNIMGEIPKEIGNLSSITSLDLSRNELSGVVPRSISGLQMVQRLLISDNRLSGVLPSSICNLQHLGELNLGGNIIWGSIPECIGNVTSLRNLYLNPNRLNCSIPLSLWNLKDLLILDLSSNYLNGSLPQQIGNLKATIYINLSHNYFLGYIPSTIGSLQQLQYIILANNLLQGSIPNTFASMISLEHMDLSNNNLTGRIPKSLETLRYLKFLNVSFNRLSGEIPSKGPFKKFGYLSFLSNEGLCGSSRLKVPPCAPTSNSHRPIRRLLWIVLISIAILVVGISLVILHKCKSKKSIANEVNLFQELVPPRISYYELQQATQGFDSSNLLGTGSFGSVYKGIFTNGLSLAIKVFNSQVEGAFKSFDIECQVLRNLRHRNLTKVISVCSNLDFKALILQYMPHGSLDNWLYYENQSLDIMQRLNIMIDVACGLEYLHYGNNIPVVHCDLKPSNVLLDEDMVGHVSDFGISKLLGDDRSIAYTCTMATTGYIAPEYGSRGMVSTRCDVYSYGIMLMEVFTRKRPSNEMFSGDLSLKSWVYNSLSSTPELIVDSTLLRAEELQFSQKLQCISTILELALNCTVESPEERVDIRVVLTKLNKIKRQLLTIL